MSGASVRIAAVILAAGRSSRFGGDDQSSKVVAQLQGVALVRTIALAALRSKAVSVTVVTGHDHVNVEAALDGLVAVHVTHNPAFASGMASSLNAGLATLPPDVDGMLVMLGDMPLVRSDTLDKLIACFAEKLMTIDAVIPTFHGERGNPVLIGARLFSALRRLRGDKGARHLLSTLDVEVERYEVDDPGITEDIDTPEALSTLESTAPRRPHFASGLGRHHRSKHGESAG